MNARTHLDYRLIARVRALLGDTQKILRDSYEAAAETRRLLIEIDAIAKRRR
jgi:hypothetical protein